MQIPSPLKAVIAVVIPQLAGLIGAFFTNPATSNWYIALQKPTLNPPAWVFGPVWTLLYFLMGVAAFLVWKKGWQYRSVKKAVGFFLGQLIVNISWSIVFFGAKQAGYAFLDIILLWGVILATIVMFYRVSRLAAVLMLPYIVWVSFAAYLNGAIYFLNRG